MKMCGVYRINLGNDYFYIGSSCDLSRREQGHRSQLKKNKHNNELMQRVFNKYQFFEFTILELCDPKDQLAKEQTYLNNHIEDKKNVNIASSASHPMMGKTHTKNAKKKISLAGKNRIITPEHRKNISDALTGKTLSDAHKAAISKAHKSSTKAAAHRDKLHKSRIGKKSTDETRKKQSDAWRKSPTSVDHLHQLNKRPVSPETRKKHSQNMLLRWSKVEPGKTLKNF